MTSPWPPTVGDVGGGRLPGPPTNTSAVEFLPVRVVGDEVSLAHTTSPRTATGATPIEIVGASSWRVRILAGFDPELLMPC